MQADWICKTVGHLCHLLCLVIALTVVNSTLSAVNGFISFAVTNFLSKLKMYKVYRKKIKSVVCLNYFYSDYGSYLV